MADANTRGRERGREGGRGEGEKERGRVWENLKVYVNHLYLNKQTILFFFLHVNLEST